jgi:hypothetical protein
MPESGTSGSVGASGGQPLGATRLRHIMDFSDGAASVVCPDGEAPLVAPDEVSCLSRIWKNARFGLA